LIAPACKQKNSVSELRGLRLTVCQIFDQATVLLGVSSIFTAANIAGNVAKESGYKNIHLYFIPVGENAQKLSVLAP
jgi:hypothetical protein